MFDFLDFLNFVRREAVNGEMWIIIKSLGQGFSLAVKETDGEGKAHLPAQVCLIQIPQTDSAIKDKE